MDGESRLGQLWRKIADWVSDQSWFQQLVSKWEELDVQSRLYLKYVGALSVVFLILFTLVSAFWRVHSLQSEYAEKMAILNTLQRAGEELKKLKESANGSRLATGTTGPWPPYFELTTTSAGIEKSRMSLSQEKAGTSTDMAKEVLYDVSLKKVNIKQAIRYAYMLENGTRPVKVRNLTLDTKMDPSGYLEATIAVSAFTLVEKK